MKNFKCQCILEVAIWFLQLSEYINNMARVLLVLHNSPSTHPLSLGSHNFLIHVGREVMLFSSNERVNLGT